MAKIGHPLPVLGRSDHLPDPGLRQREARGRRRLARLPDRDRGRRGHGRRLLRRATPAPSSPATTTPPAGPSLRLGPGLVDHVPVIIGPRTDRPGSVGHRRSPSSPCSRSSSWSPSPTSTPHLLAPSGYPSTRSIVSSVALTFFAYLGFAVISFTGGDLQNPRRNCRARCTSPSASPRCSTSPRPRGVRHADGGRGREVRSDRDRGSRPTHARRRRLRRHGDRRAPRHRLVRHGDSLRLGRAHECARRGRAVPDSVRYDVPTRTPRRLVDHRPSPPCSS